MKMLPILLITCLSLSASAQNWAPFPLDETSEWRLRCSEPIYINHGHDVCTSIRETNYSVLDSVFVDGNWYHRFYWTRYWNYCSSISYSADTTHLMVRAEAGVYYRKVEGFPEVVYADFNLEVGDTVPYLGLVIDSIDVIDINGHSCIRQWVPNPHNSTYPEFIIEGIGAEHHSLLDGCNYPEMLCYRERGIPMIFESEPWQNICEITDVNQEENARKLDISPNPSKGIFRIETPQKSTYRIYDWFGRMIKEGQLDGASEIDLTSAPNGIYFISVENEKGVSTARLVKQ